jgi:hypothetical protein
MVFAAWSISESIHANTWFFSMSCAAASFTSSPRVIVGDRTDGRTDNHPAKIRPEPKREPLPPPKHYEPPRAGGYRRRR